MDEDIADTKHQHREEQNLDKVSSQQSQSAQTLLRSAPPPLHMPSSVPATGTLSTTKSIVKGYATRFKSEIEAKDGVVIRKGKPDEEFRIVRFVLSDTSMSLSTPFATDLTTPTPFHIVPNPHKDQTLRSSLQQHMTSTNSVMASSSSGNVSREELLDQRMKSKTDRMC
jgi:hypothetical protein